jgi:hypothetical protein
MVPIQASYLRKKLDRSRSKSKEEKEEMKKSLCFKSIERFKKGQMKVFID